MSILQRTKDQVKYWEGMVYSIFRIKWFLCLNPEKNGIQY